MTVAELPALLTLMIVGAAAVVVMLAAAFYRSHGLAVGLTAVALTAALFTLPVVVAQGPRQVTPLIVVDAQAAFFAGLVLAAALAVTLLSYDYLRPRSPQPSTNMIVPSRTTAMAVPGTFHSAMVARTKP